MDTTHENSRNIFIHDMLKAYPVTNKNNNKVILPASLLNEIHEKKVWDHRPRDKPLIFELQVIDSETENIVGTTHVGVENFTAPPGRIGLPLKTALSLTQEEGIGYLHENPLIFLRFVEIESSPNSSMKVQPRGKGFFLEDESVVQMDIKTVLQLTLKDHLVLQEGDWIPLFWDGNRFELVVQELKPNEVIDVLNTDLTVEMLPSEETEQSMKEKEDAKQKVQDFVQAREEAFKKRSEIVDAYVEPPKEEKSCLRIRVKLPKGGAITKRFLETESLALLADMIDVELYKRKFTPMHLPPAGISYFFNIVYALPGQEKQILRTTEVTGESLKAVFQQLGIKGKTGSFSLEMVKAGPVGGDKGQEVDKVAAKGKVDFNNDWLKMADRLETNLMENDDEVDILPQSEVADIKERLVASGCDAELSENVARLYGKQVLALINMGYESNLPKAVAVLNEKKGDVNATVEKLLE